MPTDLIDRRAFRRILETELNDSTEVGAIGAANTCRSLLAALDKLPALDADGRWEKLLQGVKFLAKSPVLLYSDKVSAAGVVAELNALLVPFLLNPATPAAERRPAVERPAMIRAQRKVEGWNENLLSKWWQRIGGRWVAFSGSPGASTTSFAESEWLVCVDRDNSDPEAIRLYDLDLTSGEAAQREE
jgi:hypothetical protein